MQETLMFPILNHKEVNLTLAKKKEEMWKFHENQVFQQMHELEIWIRGDN